MGGEVLRIVLDTGVFFSRDIWERLSTRVDEIVLPAVAYAERARQIHQGGGNLRSFEILLSAFQIEVESFSRAHALRRAIHIEDQQWWKANARDAFIAGHVGPGDELWTTNPKDFITLGLDPDSIITV